MSLLLCKASVHPKSLWIACAAINAAGELGLINDIVITSANDSKHKTGSFHYSNNALDIRSKNFSSPELKRVYLQKVLQRLGPDYEGLIEAEGTDNEHFHIEFDPHGIH